MTSLFLVIILVLAALSTFFDVIPWSFNYFAIPGVIIVWIILSYNSFVTLANRAKDAWSDISVQLKRRYDLIPNLVETVKGYAAHESSAFENVTKARAAAMGVTAPADKAQAENMLSGALKTLFAVSEAYPDLKANQNFLQLQQELGECAVAGEPVEVVLRAIDSATDGPDDLEMAVRLGGAERVLGRIDGRYLSTEVASGFTGRVIGVRAVSGRVGLASVSYGPTTP